MKNGLKSFSFYIRLILKMMFNSSGRKNYLLNSEYSVITERKEESDSNSRSISKSCDSVSKKSPNNSLQKIKRQQTGKKQQNVSKLPQRPNIFNRNNNINPIKQRAHSINTFQNCLSLRSPQNKPNVSIKNKPNQSPRLDSFILKSNIKHSLNAFTQIKQPKFEKQFSQISTDEPCSLINNFMIDDQRPGFVRFSQCIIEDRGANNRKQKINKKGSLSILKNRKNAISCNKIDTTYLKFRQKNLNQKQRNLDPVKTKYNQIIQNLRDKFLQRMSMRQYSYFDLHEQEKYKDDIFPANHYSLFFSKNKLEQVKKIYAKNQQVQFIDVSWKRITQIFAPTTKLVLYKQESCHKSIKNPFSIASTEFLLSLNAVKNVSQFFVKVFDSNGQKYEKHGAYCLKIFQQNAWKSIIIDDYIPVIVLKNRTNGQLVSKPLFVDIQPGSNGQQVEIWPFLVQKAYASYYNSYESVHQGFKIIDWIEEILMTPSECYFFPDNQQISEETVKKLQKNICQFPASESIIIGINMKTKQPCIIEKRQSQTNQQVIVKTLKTERKMKVKHLFEIINTFYLFMPFHFTYFSTCSVNFNKGKKPAKQHPMTRINYRDQILVRAFNVDEQGAFSITVRQKQKRFYQRNIKKYQYLWHRCILIQKQFGGSYRWVGGKYLNEKSINFNLYLEKGQYELIIMPENVADQVMYDLTMIVLSNSQIGIEKKLYEEKQKLVQLACCDIAQRNGVFRQLNEFTCSYSYIDRATAMIIENINNEKTNSQVAIMRSIAGLKAKVDIYPFNLEFCINQHEPNFHKRKLKKTIEILIDGDSQFTVVLMMRGGIDEKFFKVFKFVS